MSASDAAPPSAGTHHGIPTWVVVVALSMLLGLQPVTTDLYLPALPQMQRALGLTPSLAQWTLSVLILSFGLTQLVWGAHRRPHRPPARVAHLPVRCMCWPASRPRWRRISAS